MYEHRPSSDGPEEPFPPPAGYSLRAVSLDDAPAIAELVNATNIAEVGFPYTSAPEVRDDLTRPGRDPDRDDALMVADDAALAGFLQIWADVPPHTEITALAWTHPDHRGTGLSAYLVRLGEFRARGKIPMAPSDARVVMRVARYVGNDAAARLFEALGFAHARTFWTMRIDLEAPQPEPDVPDGIRIARFERGRDERPVHAALTEAFRDHWGHPFPTFDEWTRRF